MTLIKSISGIRGTIGGKPDQGLTPLDIVYFTSSYGNWLRQIQKTDKGKVVIGRDARVSGEMVESIVSGTLVGLGFDVISLGLATTPTVEIAVTEEHAIGGIIITASHNPAQWNALKLLNRSGEFLSSSDGEFIVNLAEAKQFFYPGFEGIGKIYHKTGYNQRHIEMIKSLPLVDTKAIAKADFRIVIDAVNSVGGLIIPELLKSIGVKDVIELYTDPTGIFPHNPEPLPEHLSELSAKVRDERADLGFVVDPDVDRLAIVNEKGEMFGEEYTLVAVADYILKNTPGNTSSNLSSTRALRDVTESFGQKYFASAVGEVNVVEMMKKHDCIIGGEGNGGIIYPALHYGRDALVGIALFLSFLAKEKISVSELRKNYPAYCISKNKISLSEGADVDDILRKVKSSYAHFSVNDIDGVKIDMPDGWVHLRKSNTEPVIRIYAEHKTMNEAEKLALGVIDEIKKRLFKLFSKKS
jgi:phosphomannomutase